MREGVEENDEPGSCCQRVEGPYSSSRLSEPLTDSLHRPAQALGFEDFVEGVQDVLKDHKELAKVRFLLFLSFRDPS